MATPIVATTTNQLELEQWRDVIGFEGLYQVSSFGRVRSVDRIVRSKYDGPKRIKGTIIKHSIHRHGSYRFVHLSKNGARKNMKVHRLVLHAFTGILGQFCCHNDGDTSNNHLSNLRWDTKKGNEADKLLHGTMPIGEKSSTAVLSEKDVLQIREMLSVKASPTKIARKYSVHVGTIYAIKYRTSWKHI